MADGEIGSNDDGRNVLDLASAMSRVKAAQASRDDVVVDMKHAKVSRLELLANDLADVFNDIPKDNDQFEFAITNGEVPRLWIDMTSFVRMGKDGREYEFVKDTRLGRTILGHSTDREAIGNRITDYIAERLIERERSIEGDWLSVQKEKSDRHKRETEELDGTPGEPVFGPANGGLTAAVWFILGLLVSTGIILASLAFDQSGQIVGWIRGLAG